MIFGPDGSMYWAEMFLGEVGRMTSDGAVTTQTIGPGVNSLVFSSDGRLFVTEPWITDTLWELDPAFVDPPQQLAAGLGGLKNLEFGPDGLLYGALMWAGQVVKMDVDDPASTTEVVADGIPGPFTARFGPDGMLYVVERTGFTVQRMDPATGSHSTYVELPFGPDNIAFAPTGVMFVSSYTDGVVAMVASRRLDPADPAGGADHPSRHRGPGRGRTVSRCSSATCSRCASTTAPPVRSAASSATDSRPSSSAARCRWRSAGDNLVLTISSRPAMRASRSGTRSPARWSRIITEFRLPMNAIAFGDDLDRRRPGNSRGAGAGGARRRGRQHGARQTPATRSTLPSASRPPRDDLWVGDWATGMIWQLIADGQELPQPVPVAQGLAGPEGMAVDRDGSLLVVEGTAGRVSRVRPQTGAVTPVVGGLALSLVGEGCCRRSGSSTASTSVRPGAIYVAGDLGNLVYRLVPRTLYLPGAANTPGFNGSRWTTDLELHNRGDDPAAYTVELLLRGQANNAPRRRSPSSSPRTPACATAMWSANCSRSTEPVRCG